MADYWTDDVADKRAKDKTLKDAEFLRKQDDKDCVSRQLKDGRGWNRSRARAGTQLEATPPQSQEEVQAARASKKIQQEKMACDYDALAALEAEAAAAAEALLPRPNTAGKRSPKLEPVAKPKGSTPPPMKTGSGNAKGRIVSPKSPMKSGAVDASARAGFSKGPRGSCAAASIPKNAAGDANARVGSPKGVKSGNARVRVGSPKALRSTAASMQSSCKSEGYYGVGSSTANAISVR